MAELMGKDFIYTGVFLRRVLVASLCTFKLVELELGCGRTHGEGLHIHQGSLTLCTCWSHCVPSNWLRYSRGVAELMETDFIYTRFLLRRAHVGS